MKNAYDIVAGASAMSKYPVDATHQSHTPIISNAARNGHLYVPISACGQEQEIYIKMVIFLFACRVAF